jgi:hypothetical protein
MRLKQPWISLLKTQNGGTVGLVRRISSNCCIVWIYFLEPYEVVFFNSISRRMVTVELSLSNRLLSVRHLLKQSSTKCQAIRLPSSFMYRRRRIILLSMLGFLDLAHFKFPFGKKHAIRGNAAKNDSALLGDGADKVYSRH